MDVDKFKYKNGRNPCNMDVGEHGQWGGWDSDKGSTVYMAAGFSNYSSGKAELAIKSVMTVCFISFCAGDCVSSILVKFDGSSDACPSCHLACE